MGNRPSANRTTPNYKALWVQKTHREKVSLNSPLLYQLSYSGMEHDNLLTCMGFLKLRPMPGERVGKPTVGKTVGTRMG